jgi:hypothetical protein
MTTSADSACNLTNGRVEVRVRGPSAALTRLRGYFAPWLEPSDRSGGDFYVEMHIGAPADTHLLRERVARVERLRNENTGKIRYADVFDVRGVKVYRLDQTASTVWCRPGLSECRIYAESAGDLFWDTKDILQRQILQPIMQRSTVLMHAAAVAIDGSIVAATGGKGSGKSTVQLVLASKGAKLVSADRLYAGIGSGRGCYAWGYPARSCIDRHTFSVFPALGTPAGLESDGSVKVLMPLRELGKRLGTGVQASGVLRAILLCRRQLNSEPTVARISPEQVPDIVSDNWFEVSDPIVPNWLPVAAATPADKEKTRRKVLQLIADQVPVFEVAHDVATFRQHGAFWNQVLGLR